MIILPKPLEFDWDRGNIHKSYEKHGIAPNEAEQVFSEEYVAISEDVVHSKSEPRFIAIGQTFEEKTLFIIYTVRGEKIRIVSARPASKKERRLYEKTKKDTTI